MSTNQTSINSSNKNSKLNDYLKYILLFIAIINFKNINICASLILITSICNIVEKVKKSKVEKDKYNTMMIIAEVIVSIICIGSLILYNIM